MEDAAPSRPGKVFGNQSGLDTIGQVDQAAEMSGIGLGIGCKREPDTVQGDRMSRADRLEPRKPRTAATGQFLRCGLIDRC